MKGVGLGLIYAVSLWGSLTLLVSLIVYTSRLYRKGKKEGKHESKADKNSEIEKFKSNADLWEAKFNITEISRIEYREATRALAKANEELANQQYRAEKDTNDIITFLKRADREKTATVSLLLSFYIFIIIISLSTSAVNFLLICLLQDCCIRRTTKKRKREGFTRERPSGKQWFNLSYFTN